MPTLDQIYVMMEAQKTPYIRVYNMNRERIFTIESDSVESTKQQMDTLLPFIQSYGKVLIEAADEKIKSRNYAKAYMWTCEFSKPAGATIQGPQNNWQAIPKEYMHQDIVAAQIKMLELRMEHEKEMRIANEKLKEKETQDPVALIEKFGPVLMYAMGKPLHEIQQIASVYKGSAIAGPAAQTAQATHTLKFSDVQALPDAEKSKKCQDLANELAKHISIEHMILLQEGLIKKLSADPTFINTILLYI